ncbi:glycosyltransferase, partial [Arthrobacter deserti]|nr:glycosyltransferase [Arthrobacter deserti]
MILLIPSYEPDQRPIELARPAVAADPALQVLIVDVGSGPRYRPVFNEAEALGCTVIGHHRNQGKGRALKTGFSYVRTHLPGRDVVCADSDGQHTIGDILRVAERAWEAGTMVLGEGQFDGEVPWRSRFGNNATRTVFSLATGRRLRDTQTGLRAYPAAMLPWLLSVPGSRDEYELDLLLQARRARHRIDSVAIATVYLERNRSSHFRPLADSVRIWAPLLKFSLSSLAAFAVDLAVFLVLSAATGPLPAAVIGARAISTAANFTANRLLVFAAGRGTPVPAAAVRYFGLVLTLLAANYALMFLLTEAGLPELPAKLATEAAL